MPAHAESICRGSPRGDDGCQERGDALDELPESQRAGRSSALHHAIDKRIQRGLHDGVAYSEEGKGEEQHGEVEGEHRHSHCCQRHHETQQDGILAPNLVHQQACRDAEDEEPEEHKRGERVGHRVGETEIGLHVVAGYAYHIDEAHGEEAQHDGDKLPVHCSN